MENHSDDKKHEYCHGYCCGGGGSFWGWFLIIVGVYFLAQQYGFVPNAFWPVLLIGIGIYFLTKRKRKNLY